MMALEIVQEMTLMNDKYFLLNGGLIDSITSLISSSRSRLFNGITGLRSPSMNLTQKFLGRECSLASLAIFSSAINCFVVGQVEYDLSGAGAEMDNRHLLSL
ncbi:hypothetical protein FEM48_Zijuj02G0102400 [Ziziphus jujuba var. spinosa]|uniref:Uncharacterized protein n=1 Tax=Ziziphus jujuba var. spinosa TaxID=714518 RepID=A0A978VV59_ZIZJJ|nr:hypothetical protein FEM48_Zijuj02G0102400 [Ziziphus jujuba var. spinosa]